MAPNITVRLLYAASQAYYITTDGSVPAEPLRSAGIGYGAPTGFVTGPDATDAGLFGEAPDGIIVAFRGTLPPDSPNHGQVIRDWLIDIDAAQVAEPGIAGLVHAGFRDAVDFLWPVMAPGILAAAAASPLKPIYITGHSKGGAMANLAALKCKAALAAVNLANQIIVCTFAAPKSGNQGYAKAYATIIPNSTRYEYADDIVPHVPPSAAFELMFEKIPVISDVLDDLTLGYVAVGELQFINWSDKIVGESAGLDIQRFAHLSELALTFNFEMIVNDHRIGVGSGYAKGIGADGS